MTDGNRSMKIALAAIAAGALVLPGNLFGIFISGVFFIDISSGKNFECKQISVIAGDTFPTATAVAQAHCTGDIDDAARLIRERSRGEVLDKGEIVPLP